MVFEHILTSDFNSVFEYNNYVEDNENKIYDLTYGNSFRLKSLLKEIEEFQKGNLLIIRKNNEELNRKKKEWKQKVDKDQEYYQHIIKKHREEDQAKLSKNNVSKHDTELINKIAQQAQADVKNIVSIVGHSPTLPHFYPTNFSRAEGPRKIRKIKWPKNGLFSLLGGKFRTKKSFL